MEWHSVRHVIVSGWCDIVEDGGSLPVSRLHAEVAFEGEAVVIPMSLFKKSSMRFAFDVYWPYAELSIRSGIVRYREVENIVCKAPEDGGGFCRLNAAWAGLNRHQDCIDVANLNIISTVSD